MLSESRSSWQRGKPARWRATQHSRSSLTRSSRCSPATVISTRRQVVDQKSAAQRQSDDGAVHDVGDGRAIVEHLTDVAALRLQDRTTPDDVHHEVWSPAEFEGTAPAGAVTKEPGRATGRTRRTGISRVICNCT